jgi:hypothetical protein
MMAKIGQAITDKLLGGTMMLTALVVFTYYTAWAILLVCSFDCYLRLLALK